MSHRWDVWYVSVKCFAILFLPWSIVLCAAVYLSVAALKREWLASPSSAVVAGPARPSLALLSAFFLAWLFQALFLQFVHDYPLAAATIPAIVLVGALYNWGRPSLLWATSRLLALAMMAFLWTICFQVTRVYNWERCCREGSTPELQSRLVMYKVSAYAVDAVALAEVEAYLVSQGVGDGEVTCMSGCTHPLYLDLNLTPTTRFPQIEMTGLFFTTHRQVILAELNASRQRFVVSDLVWTGLLPEAAKEVNPHDPLALPSEFPEQFALMYPWREPIVFRSGRYLVHRVTVPADKFWREDLELEREPTDSPYTKYFAGNQSFRDEEQARASVVVIDSLYRKSEAEGDQTGKHQALLKALTISEQAHYAGKEREAEVFRHWLREQLGGADGGSQN